MRCPQCSQSTLIYEETVCGKYVYPLAFGAIDFWNARFYGKVFRKLIRCTSCNFSQQLLDIK